MSEAAMVIQNRAKRSVKPAMPEPRREKEKMEKKKASTSNTRAIR